MIRRNLHLCLCIAVMLAGCQKQSGEPVTADPDASKKKTAIQDEVCLADPAGSSALDERIRFLQKQTSSLPGKAENWIRVGQAWVQKARVTADGGYYVNVQHCAESALMRDISRAGARSLLALTLLNSHHFAEAKSISEEILRVDPQDLIAHGVRADALLELGLIDQSAESVQQMMDLRPDMASYSRASYIRWLHGDNAGARILIRYALEARNPNDPEPAAWAYVQAGILYWSEGDYEGAEAIFNEALKWVPDYPPALMGAGRAALSRKNATGAIKYLSRAFDRQPSPECAWLLGDALSLAGDIPGANRAYQQVVDLGRKSDPLTLASFYAARNRDLKESIQLIEEERKKRGGLAVEDIYAWVLYRLGRFGEAQKVSEKILRLGTRDARWMYHAGAIQLANGDNRGRDLIRRALAQNPEFDFTESRDASQVVNGNAYAKQTTK